MAEGGFRLSRMLDSISRPGSSPQHHDAPGGSERRPADYRHFRVVRPGREPGLESERAGPMAEVHSRVVLDVRFGDGHPGHARQLGQQGKADEPFRVQAAELPPLVLVLVRRRVVPEDERVRRGILGEPELGSLSREADLSAVPAARG